MEQWLERTALLVEEKGIEKLQNANVLIIGLGGVGSFAAEFLARAGVGHMTIVDGDRVDVTNVNRQFQALHSTVDLPKVELMETRIKDINPKIELTCIGEFLTPDRMEQVVSLKFDYVLDCIDSVSPKIFLIETCVKQGVKIISSMGAGGKLDSSKVKVEKIEKTYNCTLARTIRKRLKSKGIRKGFKVVFSTERQDPKSLKMTDGSDFKTSYYGTISYMPAVFGLHAAGFVVNEILNNKKQ